jgi:protein TonB
MLRSSGYHGWTIGCAYITDARRPIFEVLLASGPHDPFRTRWLSTSVVIHTTIFALVVLATQSQRDAPRAADDRAIPLFMPPIPEPAPPEPTTALVPPGEIVAEPPPGGVQTVIPPVEIPNLTPAINVNQRPLDPRDFTGHDTEGGLAGGQGPVTADSTYEATTILEGFEPASVISQPVPRYPASLEAAGLEGRVMVEFVIDAIGRVEPNSIRATGSTHPAFEAAARATILASVFRPAKLGIHPVRQLTQQTVRFVAGP